MICMGQQRAARIQRNQSNSVSGIGPLQIQIQDADTDCWRLYASFSFQGEAEACLDALQQRGIQARMLSREFILTTS